MPPLSLHVRVRVHVRTYVRTYVHHSTTMQGGREESLLLCLLSLSSTLSFQKCVLTASSIPPPPPFFPLVGSDRDQFQCACVSLSLLCLVGWRDSILILLSWIPRCHFSCFRPTSVSYLHSINAIGGGIRSLPPFLADERTIQLFARCNSVIQQNGKSPLNEERSNIVLSSGI